MNVSYIDKTEQAASNLLNFVDNLYSSKGFSNSWNQYQHAFINKENTRLEHLIAQDIVNIFSKSSSQKPELSSKNEEFIFFFYINRLKKNDALLNTNPLALLNLFKQGAFKEDISKLAASTSKNSPMILAYDFLKTYNEKSATEYLVHLHEYTHLMLNVDQLITEIESEFLSNLKKGTLSDLNTLTLKSPEKLEDLMVELNNLVGLENIKTSVTELINLLKVQTLRKKNNLSPIPFSLHSVFMGKPGTGKTTIARLISRIYKSIGVLKKGHLVEVDRAGLVAGYVGQTAQKVDEVVQKALDGVLFIDEAYSLAKGDEKDFGNEALEILLKRMEDHRDRLIVIVAGYSEEMKLFIESNPGLKSRFNHFYDFKDYNAQELLTILEGQCTKHSLLLDNDAKEKVFGIFELALTKKTNSFGNARECRNLFEIIIVR